MQISLLHQESKYKGRIFEVMQQKLEVDGNDIVRDVVLKNACVVCLVHNLDKDTVVLTREFRVGTFEEELGFIAGIVDDGEKPIHAAIRETIEETGYTPVGTKYLGDSYTSSGFTNERIHHYYVTVSGERAPQSLDGDEHIVVEEVPYSRLGELIAEGWIRGNHAHATVLKAILHEIVGLEFDHESY